MKLMNSAGSAKKKTISQYQYRDGANAVRLFGDLLPRYIYWVKGENDKNLPLECLEFDREKESFTSGEKDWVKVHYPDLKPNWSYSIQCIDLTDDTVKVFNLKKKLMDQILTKTLHSAIDSTGDKNKNPGSGLSFPFQTRLTIAW